jgi:hypothetical protein
LFEYTQFLTTICIKRGGGKRRVVTGNVTQQELTNVLKRQQEDEEGDNLKEEVTKGFSR